MKKTGVLLSIFALMLSCKNEQKNNKEDTKSKTPSVYYIDNVSVIDGTGSLMQKNMTLLIDNGLIKDIQKTVAENKQEKIAIIDGTGKYVIPGLIDSHAHIDGETTKSVMRALRGGVTVLRDVGGASYNIKNIINRLKANETVFPQIYFSTFFGGKKFVLVEAEERMHEDKEEFEEAENGEEPEMEPGYIEKPPVEWMKLVEADSDLEELVKQVKDSGATGIKLYYDITADKVKAIAKEAKKQGLKVWGHTVVHPARVEDLIEAGADVLSHAGFLLEDGASYGVDNEEELELDRILNLMKDNNVILDATLLVVYRIVKNNPKEKAVLEATYKVTKRANELGVKIVAGTDEPLPVKDGELPPIHEEMELMVSKAQMSPMQVLVAATKNGADILDLGDVQGTIEKGKKADIIILDKNPLENIGNTRTIFKVIKDGHIIQ